MTRPNVGCRELVKRNLIRILPAIRNDLTDWVVCGRIKASQLLAILTWQAEETITQHLEDTLQVCSKAIVDDQVIVREQVTDRLQCRTTSFVHSGPSSINLHRLLCSHQDLVQPHSTTFRTSLQFRLTSCDRSSPHWCHKRGVARITNHPRSTTNHYHETRIHG